MTITYPSSLVPRTCNPELRNAARSGGVSLSGQEQRVMGMSARWEVTYDFVLTTFEQVNQYRAMMGRLRQGEDINLTIFDMHKPGNFGGDTAQIFDVGLGATVLQFQGLDTDIDVGHHISIGGNRLHLVTEVNSEVAVNTGIVLAISGSGDWDDDDVWVDGSIYTTEVKIIPPTRANYGPGTTLNLNVLKLRAVLKDINDGDIGLEFARWGQPSVTFVEYIT